MLRSLAFALPAIAITLCAPNLAAQAPRVARVQTDTLVARYGTTVIGRGITTRTYRGAEVQQTYIWRSASDGSSITDSLWLDATSLQPSREVRIVADTVIRVVYGKARFEVSATSGGKDLYRRTVQAPIQYHSSASLETLAARMPLQRDAAATFNTYYPPPSSLGFQTSRVRVVEEDVVGGKPAWRIVAATPSGSTTFWVHPTTREVVQYDVQEGPVLITFRR